MSYRYPDAQIIIFSKAPEAGLAKTRLIPQLGEQGAAEFSARLTRYAVAQAVNSQLCPVQLYCAPNTSHTLFQDLHKVYSIELKQQQGQNLGVRMAHALTDALTVNRSVLLIGSDCPAITASYLEQALEKLNSTASCILGPAEDGGYVLVGQSSLNVEMFENIDWGTEKVLQQTRQHLNAAEINYAELATLWDVDRPADIVRACDLMTDEKSELI